MSLDSIWAALSDERVLDWLRGGLILLGGFLAARMLAAGARRLLESRGSAQTAMVGQRLTFYGVFFLMATIALQHLGFDLSILLGAAGILTVALGFASQTSASNLISGLFLLGERPFSVGDLISVENRTGFVLSIDLLSVKLRTFDNLLVRLPNETLLKTPITNLTRFPIRRIDLQVPVAYKEDLGRVQEILEQAAEEHPLCLEEPAPLLIFRGFGESSLDLQFSVWAERTNFLTVKNEVLRAVKEAFDREGIEIPFPHRTLYAGSATRPLPVHLAGDEDLGKTVSRGSPVEPTERDDSPGPDSRPDGPG
ncbi:MAG: mechanosensitive ion channel family protein [Thermoanaerobaculia bacterium]|nr:mechanosensitive ion channel family protein [Thermoanaerobaculia bacterium]